MTYDWKVNLSGVRLLAGRFCRDAVLSQLIQSSFILLERCECLLGLWKRCPHSREELGCNGMLHAAYLTYN